MNITFYLDGLDTNYQLYVFFKNPEGQLEMLASVDSDGDVHYQDSSFGDRIHVSYGKNYYSGVITIFQTKKEDSGVYYVGLFQNETLSYPVVGTRLTVSGEIPIN